MNYFAHPTAVIDEGSNVGAGTRIWHFCHVSPGSIIGNNCTLGQNVYIGPGVNIGNNVKIQNNVSVYEGVICEDDVFLGPSMVFTNVINPRSAVSQKNSFIKTLVRKGATIGANAVVICGNEIGEFAFIGAAAVVTKPIPAYALFMGNPAKQAGWVSELGEKLEFNEEGKSQCKKSGTQYQLLNGKVNRI